MPDLGKYADAVLSAYGASLLLLALLVVITFTKGRKARAGLDAVEDKESPRG